CKSVGVIVDGCPPGIALSEQDVQPQLDRRRPGQSNLTTPRNEKDRVEIQAGVELGYTLGSPIAMRVPNEDQRPHDYGDAMTQYPRPSHADWTYLQKYGVKSSSGGGRSSARETIGRVAASAIAEKYLKQAHGIEVVAFVASVGNVHAEPPAEYDAGHKDAFLASWHAYWERLHTITREQVDADLVRCPFPDVSAAMKRRIEAARDDHDSIGGTIVCVIRGVPAGLGEPAFDKLQATLAHAMLSIPATKGFEYGSGFAGGSIPGHVHNDAFVLKDDAMRTHTNFSGGIQGGISNGEPIYFKVVFKPAATIGQAQATANYAGVAGTLAAKGRHDPCVLPRAVPIVEAMATLTIIDALLVQYSRQQALQHTLPGAAIPAPLRPLKPADVAAEASQAAASQTDPTRD
ncbi:chorismate synthase, partial [Caulochytrium protostelioides]